MPAGRPTKLTPEAIESTNMERSLDGKEGDFYIKIEFLFSWNGWERYGVSCESKHHNMVVDRIVKKRDIKKAITKCQKDLLAAEIDFNPDSPDEMQRFTKKWDQVQLRMMHLRELPSTEVNNKMLPTTYGSPS